MPKIGIEKGVFFTTEAQCGSLWHLPVPTGGLPHPPLPLCRRQVGLMPTVLFVPVDKPLPSLDDTDSMLPLNQHGELGGHLKYVFTLQDDIPLWRQRGDSKFQMSGLNVDVPQCSA